MSVGLEDSVGMEGAVRRALELVRVGAGFRSEGVGSRAVAGGAAARDGLEAHSEGLAGLLHARAVGDGVAPMAGGAAAHRDTAALNLVRLQLLEALLAQLAADGVEPVVLPGAALLRHYPDVGCRTMDDIDLLCPPGADRTVRAALRRGGWWAAARHAGIWSRGGLTVDLHGDLFNSDRIRGRRHAGWLEPADLWGRRRRLEVGGSAVQVLAPVDEVLYTAAHALRHSYRRLTWLIDLALQLRDPDLDAEALQAAAHEAGLDRPVVYGLALLQLAVVPLPESLAAWLRREPPSAAAHRWLAWTLAARRHTCAGEVLWCLTCPRWRERARLLAEFIFPRPQVLLQVFPRVPRRLAPLAYALRCAQIVHRGARELAALATRPEGRAARRTRG